MQRISGKDVVQRMSSLRELKCFTMDLNIPSQTISNWKIRDKPPKAEDLIAISEYLNVSIEWLLTGQEKNVPPDVLNLAYEINALPDVYKKIVVDTVKTLKADVLEKAQEERSSSGIA